MDNRLRLAETDGLMAAHGQVKVKKAPSFRLSDSQNPEREGVRLSGEGGQQRNGLSIQHFPVSYCHWHLDNMMEI